MWLQNSDPVFLSSHLYDTINNTPNSDLNTFDAEL